MSLNNDFIIQYIELVNQYIDYWLDILNSE